MHEPDEHPAGHQLGLRGDDPPVQLEVRVVRLDRDAFDAWAARRDALLPADRAAVAAGMDRVNPVYIPRNHRVEEALTAATAGDLGPFRTLLDVVAHPFTARPGLEDYAVPGDATPYVTYCGT